MATCPSEVGLRTPFRDLNGRQSLLDSKKLSRRSMSAAPLSRKVRRSEVGLSPVKQPFNDDAQDPTKLSAMSSQKENILSLPDLSINLDALIYQKAMDMIAAEKQVRFSILHVYNYYLLFYQDNCIERHTMSLCASLLLCIFCRCRITTAVCN